MVGEEDLDVGACLLNLGGEGSLNHRDPTLSLVLCIPSRSRGLLKPILTTNVDSVEKWGTSKGVVHAKRQGAVSGRECMNSPTTSQSFHMYI